MSDVTGTRRWSLWLLTGAMVLIIGLKSHGGPVPGLAWHWLGWPALAAGLWLGRRDASGGWYKTTVLLAYLIVVLHFTRIDGDTGNRHVLELTIKLGLGLLLVPALAAKYWLKAPLDYS